MAAGAAYVRQCMFRTPDVAPRKVLDVTAEAVIQNLLRL